MDVAQKKQEVLESIANQPLNVVYIRVDICNQVQLADLLKEDFIKGVTILGEMGYVWELLLEPHNLKDAIAMYEKNNG